MARGPLDHVSTYDEPLAVDGLRYARSVASSPDGRNLYVGCGFLANTLVVLARDDDTGELSHLETHFDGVGGVDGLSAAHSIAVTPDGRHVYVAAWRDDAVSVFERDADSGSLTFVTAYFDDVGGVDGLEGAQSVVSSPAGDHLYVVGGGEATLAVFERAQTTGELDFVEVHYASRDGVVGLNNTPFAAVSPDGRNVYVGGEQGGVLAVFARDTSTGRLSFLEASATSSGEPLVSPDGRYVFTLGADASVFRRAPESGRLTRVEVRDLPSGHFARAAAQSPDGRFVHAAAGSQDFDAVLTFGVEESFCRRDYSGLCLGDRFRVEVEWSDSVGGTGSARAVPNGSDDSSLLWFFSESNWEMLIKVLDGCQINDRFWVFGAATTDVEYTLTVTDALTGARVNYFNPLGTAAAAITDTDAFATCDDSSGGVSVSPARVSAAATPAVVTMSGAADEKSVAGRQLLGLGDLCLDAEGGATSDGTPVNLFECHRGENQRWVFDDGCSYGCPGSHSIVGVGDRCLQPEPESGGSSRRLVMGSCEDSEAQWNYGIGRYPARFSLIHQSSGLCADVEGAVAADGTPVILHECHGGANQLWTHAAAACAESPVIACKDGGRFEIEVEWRDFEGKTGFGRVRPNGSDDSGVFWFFTPENWELLVKVLDGCSINGHHWVFAAATTNVEYTLWVTDTDTGEVREYVNALGESAAAITDTSAFAGCSPER